MGPGDLLVVGGSGVVGRRVSQRLAARFPGRVTVGGRRPGHLQETCARIGHDAHAVIVDVNDPSSIERALPRVSTVVCCVRQERRELLQACVRRGLAYTDTAPDLTRWNGFEALDAAARASGACVVLGTGIAPGLSSVMAAELATRVGPLREIETSLLFSVGDELGPDSLGFLLSAADRPFSIVVDGAPKRVRPLTAPVPVDFPPPLGRRDAFLFPFSDAVGYPRTLGVGTSISRLAIDPPWLGAVARGLDRLGLLPLLRRPGHERLRHALVSRLGRVYGTHDRWSVVVRVRGAHGEASAHALGRVEADAVAVSTAELAAQLHERQIDRAGAWMPEQVLAPGAFLATLATQGLPVCFLAPPLPSRRLEAVS